MAVVNGYCSTAELRNHLGDSNNALNVGGLELAINTASRWIDQHCGRRFWQDSAVAVRTYRPDLTDVAWVHDISTTVGLIIKTDTSGDATWATTWASTDYQLEPLNASLDETGYAFWKIVAIDRYLFPLDDRRATLQVTAKFGWSAVPDAVKEACLLRASAIFKRREAVFGVAGFGDFGALRIARRDSEVDALLHPYVRLGVGAV